MKMVKMTNWSFVDRYPYRAPECHPGLSLHGDVVGHEKLGDLNDVTTSPAEEYDPMMHTVRTSTGTVYALEGEPADQWSEWLDKSGFTVTQYLDKLIAPSAEG